MESSFDLSLEETSKKHCSSLKVDVAWVTYRFVMEEEVPVVWWWSTHEESSAS